MDNSAIIEKRKKEHIDLCVNSDVAFDKKTTLLECVELNYQALPEINFSDVNLSTEFLGKQFSFPFLVSAITGGAQVSKKINLNIAKACGEMGIGMGLGSMRAMMENPKLKETYDVRSSDTKDIFLAGNIGAIQLPEYTPKQLNEIISSMDLNAIAIHLNAAQEAMQSEGDLHFSNLIEKIDEFSKELNVPVYVKEVGHGISKEIVTKLNKTKIKAIDIQGAGGTSWTRVDSLRHEKSFGDVFRNVGIPTGQALIDIKKVISQDKQIIASGGIRNGLDAIKCIVMGANMVGNALPILKAEQKSYADLIDYLKNFKKEMEIASFLLGCKNITDLHNQKYLITGKLKELV
ncbi:MAG: type 2 isopentenyl-diphosphate Delta-isomerase [Candidatus ainarchaeum sp.]|nr:type 2 isopentenyl-diphosphate Delta-isomerase [Candidatus ainarchaeum sp.]